MGYGAQATEHLHLRLSDGPLFAVTAVSAVVRGVDACRRWVEGAKALTSGRGLDRASAATLVQELQANRHLPYAVGGALRTTLAHELSLKAPDNPELAHHLGRHVQGGGTKRAEREKGKLLCHLHSCKERKREFRGSGARVVL